MSKSFRCCSGAVRTVSPRYLQGEHDDEVQSVHSETSSKFSANPQVGHWSARSLAVMSMVGHMLGLGDRHPSNLMLHRHSGKIMHIDFGDCFEVAMRREKFPETVPFRLTRMLVNAMEVSAIEGTYRSTAESVMGVLREHSDSLMAMLEAFIHDPLIKWRLLQPGGGGAAAAPPADALSAAASAASAGGPSLAPSLRASLEESFGYHEPGGGASDPLGLSLLDGTMHTPIDSVRLRQRAAHSSQAHGQFDGDDVGGLEVLNERAVRVIRRVENKLTGREFGGDELTVAEQVHKLIEQATSHQNLCQCYVGWCAFW